MNIGEYLPSRIEGKENIKLGFTDPEAYECF